MKTNVRYKVKEEHVRSSGMHPAANYRDRPDTFARDILHEIGRGEIIVERVTENGNNTGLTSFTIICADNTRVRIDISENRFRHLWCIFTEEEFNRKFEESDKPSVGDWGVWTSMPRGQSSYKGGLSKEEAVEFAKSQARHGSDEVRVMVMQPFAQAFLNVNIRPL